MENRNIMSDIKSDLKVISDKEAAEMLDRIWTEDIDRWSPKAASAFARAIDALEALTKEEPDTSDIDISTPALLELMAEECTELAHASLKLARVLRGDNPTPRTIEECEQKLVEELADVRLVADRVTNEPWFNETYISLFEWYIKEKTRRWKKRMESRK